MRWTKFIHLTDTHLVQPGQLLYGMDPLERLRLVAEWVGN